MNKKAFALISGGLDSILAAKLMQEQGIEVVGAYFESIMYKDPRKTSVQSAAEYAAEVLGIELLTFPKGKDFYRMIQFPEYGYGSAINPCVDCRIYYLKKVKALMDEYGVSFVITGEVLGQRPKSQKMRSLHTIEEASGLGGHLVRPLSAKILKPTEPEVEGILDREQLLGVEGRSRKEQMFLAEKYGIQEYPTPGGGCQLTEQEFMPKVVDMFRYVDYDDNDISLLSLRRHFRVNDTTRIIVSRDQYESEFLLSRLKDSDVLVSPDGFVGPIAIIRGTSGSDVVTLATGLVLAYSKHKGRDDAYARVECQADTEGKRIRCPIVMPDDIAALKIDLTTMPEKPRESCPAVFR